MQANSNETLRESIMHAVERLEGMYKATDLDGLVHIIDDLKSSISSPLRNCDVGTAEEQYKRFTKFCFGNMGDGMNEPRCSKCPLGKSKSSCHFDWEQMPYEE